MRSRSLLIALGLLLLAAGCGLPTRDNERFCCLSAASCAEIGGAAVTTCTDPARPYCTDDVASELGDKFTCVPDPLAHACNDPSECSAERPFCTDHVCVQCEDNTSCPPATPACVPDTWLCGVCEGDPDCQDRVDTPRCLVADGRCVQCLAPEDCGGATPVCDQSACRACEAHGECASDACDVASGACLDEADVIYVATDGLASGTCTHAAPCNSFALALAAVTGPRSTIKVAAGTYTGAIAITGVHVSILADDGVIVQPSAVNTTVISVGGGADAAIDGLTVTGAGGAGNPPAVACTGATSTLRLTRSTVVANSGGGIDVNQCQFSMVNNVVALNGSATSPYGGVEITGIATSGLHEFAFNTVTGNVGATNTTTGLECASIATPLVMSNNIVYGNTIAGSGSQVGGDSDCTWTYSDIGPGGPSGTGNLDVDPLFVDPSARNYHLGAGSPARNVADPAATLARDIDGDPRPQGGRRDMGADEVLE